MSNRDDLLLIHDMLESANKIRVYCKNYSQEDFLNDPKTIDAVIRNFEIIGEAAFRISSDYQIKHKLIPWNHLKGYRNRLIHEYFGVDLEIVWDIILDEIPDLIEILQNLHSK